MDYKDVAEQLKIVLYEYTDNKEIYDDTVLHQSLRIDSVAYIAILAEVEDIFNISFQIDELDMNKEDTFAVLCEMVIHAIEVQNKNNT